MKSLISFQKYKPLSDYEKIKCRALEIMGDDIHLFQFVDEEQEIRYRSIHPIIPEENHRQPILLLLFNPHPYIIKKEEYFPGDKKHPQHPFWKMLKATRAFNFIGFITADKLIRNQYFSPYRFFIAYFLTFPSKSSSSLLDIFAQCEFENILKIQRNEVINFIRNNRIKNVICFEATSFNALCGLNINAEYLRMLQQDKIIYGTIPLEHSIRVYLSYPVGKKTIEKHEALLVKNLRGVFDNIHGANQHSKELSLRLINLTKRKIPKNQKSQFSQSSKPTLKEKPDSLQELRKNKSEIWFVVHHEKMWDKDKNLIGFWNRNQRDIMNIGDIVIYYRAGWTQIMGVFKVERKGDNINRNFHDPSISKPTRYQCKISLILLR